MGFVGSLFGGDSGNSGGAGMNYQATGAAPYQLNDTWANTQQALQQQQAFLKALYTQNAIGNQQNVFDQQQALAGQLGQMALGAGPNPAQAQFQQNANQVAAQTAGLIGSQKGISPALQARLIAQQGAGAMQNAAGQAATLQAQQQMAAINSLQNQQQAMAGLTTNQVGQQQNALNAYQQGALGQQGNILGIQGSANSANAGVAGQTARQQGEMFQGILKGAGTAMMAHGGQVPGYAAGGPVNYYNAGIERPVAGIFGGEGPGQVSAFADFSKKKPTENVIDYSSPVGDYAPGGTEIYQSPEIAPNLMNLHGGMANPMSYAAPTQSFVGNMMTMPTGMSQGGEVKGPRSHCAKYFKGGSVIHGENYAQQMKPVPGTAKVAGDHEANDTVPAKLSPGEIIIPRSIAQHPNAPDLAAQFVAAVMAKNGRRLG